MDATTTLRSAIDELVYVRGRLQHRDMTTVNDALEYADDAACKAWLESELGSTTLPAIIDDVLACHCSELELQRFVDHLFLDSDVVRKTILRALRCHVADHLASECDALLERDEPRGSYAAEVADPVRDDLRAMAKATRPW